MEKATLNSTPCRFRPKIFAYFSVELTGANCTATYFTQILQYNSILHSILCRKNLVFIIVTSWGVWILQSFPHNSLIETHSNNSTTFFWDLLPKRFEGAAHFGTPITAKLLLKTSGYNICILHLIQTSWALGKRRLYLVIIILKDTYINYAIMYFNELGRKIVSKNCHRCIYISVQWQTCTLQPPHYTYNQHFCPLLSWRKFGML